MSPHLAWHPHPPPELISKALARDMAGKVGKTRKPRQPQHANVDIPSGNMFRLDLVPSKASISNGTNGVWCVSGSVERRNLQVTRVSM